MKKLCINTNQKVELNKKINKFTLIKNDTQAEIVIDLINNRLRIIKIIGSNLRKILNEIYEIAKLNQVGKIWAIVAQDQWQELLEWGYVLEAILPKYYISGPAYHMSYFLEDKRHQSKLWKKEDEIIREIYDADILPNLIQELPKEYKIKEADINDCNNLANFYSKIFSTYPAPINDSKYISKLMSSKAIFSIILYQNKIIASASADIDNISRTVEITDIGCDPEHRGKNLTKILIKDLEKKLDKLGLVTFYSFARASLPAINKIFFSLGYKYYGRLMNNCHICGNYEDMNLFAKVI